ncbi:MAG: bifunctional phosphopantothenoylcysteine decarboxylase/phosphopantothenate--cysteine ligase CoaBC [Bacteroidetes bacterium]|nr:bifunctional phosphopantothenoylcysteine decarboxylase/phosphopantothenate--cysteine ligase CoaBC [Bacteroidota bacterium]
MLKGKKILLGITGSIAAYKAVLIVRQLVKEGAEVRVIMTPSATAFITPLTLSTLSKNEVLCQLSDNDSWANHVMLGRWADIMLIAPLSCNTLAKMANGICDNLLLAVYLSATCPVVLAPAMDEDMWHHPSTQQNILKVKSFGNHIIPVSNGELASGLVGEGRMDEPSNIISWIKNLLSKSNDLVGKKVLVTAGPTYEAIDPVRFIGNHSSGKMGIALAEEFNQRGAQVTLVAGPVAETLPDSFKTIKVISANEMLQQCMNVFPQMDIIVMAAAVADYTIETPAVDKIKKKEESFAIQLKKTTDILQTIGKEKLPTQFLAGFALETNNEKENAIAKLKSKNADIIILNSLNDKDAGFGYSTNKITIFDKQGNEYPFATKSKKEIAADIVNTIISIANA